MSTVSWEQELMFDQHLSCNMKVNKYKDFFHYRQLLTGYGFATTGAIAVALGLNHLAKVWKDFFVMCGTPSFSFNSFGCHGKGKKIENKTAAEVFKYLVTCV